MKIYTVYTKLDEEDPHEHSLFIKEGFSFLGFLFTLFWALYYRVWDLCAIIFVALMCIGMVEHNAWLPEEITGIIQLFFQLWVGFSAFDWQRKALEKRGYVMQRVVAAKDEFEAQQRYFDAHTASIHPSPLKTIAV